MSYNNKYNTRHSGRFNTPGQFVPAAELAGGAAPRALRQRNPNLAVGQPYQQQPYNQAPLPPPPRPPQHLQQPKPQQQQQQQQQQPNPQQPQPQLQNTDVEMKQEADVSTEGGSSRPPWMKNKLMGVKKISNKERRRRQNEHLRRLLTPKNALMVLNEMMPNEQLATQFKVEAAGSQFYKANNSQSFCADLTLDGQVYKGYGDNKLSARNAAAEKAVRDMIIKRMAKAFSQEAKEGKEENGGGATGDEETLPMIQLASFALHKLFSEWEYEGIKVPQLKPHSGSTSEPVVESPPPPPKPKPPMKRASLPNNAASLHPCMLLTYMRPGLEYRELAVSGDKPQSMLFTMGVDVDGATYIGKASNKKEARRAAARSACAALFGVQFPDTPTAAPLVA